MNKINKIPRGLLDLFGVKQQGDFPSNYSKDIGMVYDIGLLQLYTQTESFYSTIPLIVGAGTNAAGTFNVPGPVGNLTVPDQEIWVMLEHRVNLEVTGVGASCAMPHLGYTTPQVTGVNGFVPFGSDYPRTIIAGAATPIIAVGGGQAHPNVIPGSSIIVIELSDTCTGVAGGDIRARAFMRFVRLQA